jgi:hypothetical protein
MGKVVHHVSVIFRSRHDSPPHELTSTAFPVGCIELTWGWLLQTLRCILVICASSGRG